MNLYDGIFFCKTSNAYSFLNNSHKALAQFLDFEFFDISEFKPFFCVKFFPNPERGIIDGAKCDKCKVFTISQFTLRRWVQTKFLFKITIQD